MATAGPDVAGPDKAGPDGGVSAADDGAGGGIADDVVETAVGGAAGSSFQSEWETHTAAI